jgi:hypothetical protein
MPRNTKSVDFDEETLARIENLKQQKGLPSFKATEDFIHARFFEGKTVSDDSIPEKCKSCLKFGNHVENGKVLCVTKKTLGEPMRFHWIPLDVAQGCSEMPFNTPLNKKTREQFEREFSNMEKMKIHHQNRADELRPKAERLSIAERQLEQTTRELEEARTGKEDLLSVKSTLESRVSDMANTFLENRDKIVALETDNEQLRAENAKLSENEVLTENDSLRMELNEKIKLIDDTRFEIEKLEALTQKQRQTIDDVISKTKSTFREFRQYLPTSLEPYAISEYIKNAQKKIELFDGYLDTVAP